MAETTSVFIAEESSVRCSKSKVFGAGHVNKIWFASSLGGRIQAQDDSSFVAWIVGCTQVGDADFLGRISELIWVIWYERNQWVFNRKKFPLQYTLEKA
ncbi:hypothetical protein JHK87_016817 [Glycine soja]|nr:hypothetical protein JHK87_016817 [Glycine soja]